MKLARFGFKSWKIAVVNRLGEHYCQICFFSEAIFFAIAIPKGRLETTTGNITDEGEYLTTTRMATGVRRNPYLIFQLSELSFHNASF